MAVIESNNRILRAGDSPVGTRYFDGDYIHIDENNHINFTGDFSGLSAKVDECCADAHGQISAIKGSVSSLSSQFVDCCSSVNTDLTEIWNAVNANSANITNNSNNISTLSGNTALLDSIKLDISAYTEAETVPWITAWKNVSNNLTANFGDTYCFLSSIDVSGNKNHAVGVKGSYITLPTTGHIASALDDRLTISSFSSYTSYADGRMDSIFQLANSAYTTAVNNYYNKVDKSALSSYVPYSAIGGTTNIITGINGSALSAGANYTAGPNINITGNEISGKDWTDDITAASANAVNEAVNNITAVSYANSSNVSNSALTANYALSSDSAKYDNLGREITATYLTAVTGDNIAYTAGANIDITNHVVSGKDWSDDITAASSYAYEQATASIPSVQEYSAGDNIDITNHVVSGKDWSSEISDASANAVNEAINNITAVSYAATANISNSALTANYALSSDSATYDSDGNKITETYLSALPEGVITTANTFVSSVNNLTPELVSGGINGHELKLSGSTPTGLPLSGVSPIKIEKINGKVVISYTGGAGEGKVYTGIAPIVVDNTTETGTISAQTAAFGVQAPLYFVEDTTASTVIGISGLPEVEGLMYESALNLGDGYITGYNGSALSSERSRYAVSATSANGAISSQTAAVVTGGWETADGKITGYNGTAFYTGAGNTYDVTAGSNINVATAGNTFTISGKDWSDAITAASSYAYSQATANDNTYDVTAGANVNVATAGNTFTISSKDWSDAITAASSYAYNQATANDNTYDVTAGDNINVSTADNTFTISGKDWSDAITAASSYAYNQATANDNTYDVTAGANVNVATAGNTFTVSSKDWSDSITAASSYAYSQATANDKTYDVTAGDNINISTAGNTFTVSGKNWSDDITAASSYAYSQATADAQGKIYEGISPIVVDNDLDKISASTYQLAVESPLQIVPSSVNGNDYQVIQLTGGVPTQSVPHLVDLYDEITWDELVSAYENSGIVNPAIAHVGGNYYAHIHDKSVGSFSSFTFTFDRSISSKMSIVYSSNGNTTGVYTSTREIAPSTVEAICMTDSQSAYEVIDPGSIIRYCITVPYEYNNYPQYRFTVNNKDFIINSGCYVEIQKAQVEGSVKWCVCHSGYYNN